MISQLLRIASSPLPMFCYRAQQQNRLLLLRTSRGRGLVHHANHQGTSAAAATTTGTTTTIGILRESYDKWERRTPLTPDNVRRLLLDSTSQLKILVQPSSTRIFSNASYEAAGATLTEDLSPADILLGVKRPAKPYVANLLENKTYLFFSHTIKGQQDNMDVLQECLTKNVQLLDYERMMDLNTNQRLVSFGRFAGLAGAMDTFSGLGKRLLYAKNVSTPFLSCPPAWMHANLEDAKEAIRRMGRTIESDGIPIPVIISVTGLGGAVHNGAMEMLTQLPHELVSVSELAHVSRDITGPQKQIYLVPVDMGSIFRRSDGTEFDRKDYLSHPAHYRSLFAQKVAPYTDAIVNCVYWDARYPRLLTKKQVKRMYEKTNNEQQEPRLLFLADISCDLNGSMEILDRSTTIESPFYQYDPLLEREVAAVESSSGNKGTITIMGVDILPAELPKDASEHFGRALEGVVQELVAVRQQQQQKQRQQDTAYDQETINGVDPTLLSPRLIDSCITTIDGQLMPGYQYLDMLMKRAVTSHADAAAHKTMVLSLTGHLFDSGLINQILDVVEAQASGDGAATLNFDECIVPPLMAGGASSKSSVLLRITAKDEETINKIESKVRVLVDVIPKAETVMYRVELPSDKDKKDSDAAGKAAKTATVDESKKKKEKRVLVLGAGHVSKALVDFLGRDPSVRVTVASEREEDARRIAAAAVHGRHVEINVTQDADSGQLSSLVADSDLVVSLLPAPMHPSVAQECIRHKANLVTASYESPEMRLLEQRAQEAGIVILNEVGLDPGLDHMSAMKILDDIKLRGGTVTTFSSVCGGLPAPDAADNPLRYKFSWSPMGVIRASQNAARFRSQGAIQEVNGFDLLRSAMPFVDAWPELHLECLPNRDSLKYEQAYDIQGASTVFRGTLRYRGFSALMDVFQGMGLFAATPVEEGVETWDEAIHRLRIHRGDFRTLKDFVEKCAEEDSDTARRAMEALEWLGLVGANAAPIRQKEEVVQEFCRLLESKLHFEEGERDMVVMHHRIEATFAYGTDERHISSLKVFGDEKASAMAKTVGYTAAAAAELILDGTTLRNERGLLMPTSDKIYLPVLDRMEREGIAFEEKVSVDTAAEHVHWKTA